MSYKINTTNQPEGSDLIEVDDAEFIDLQRMGLIAKGKGDVNAKGELKRDIAADAPAETVAARPATGSIPTQPTAA